MVEMEDFKYGGTNITAFRLVNPSSELVQGVIIYRNFFIFLEKKVIGFLTFEPEPHRN